MAPLPRVPAAVGEFTAIRRHDTVVITFVVPTANAAGDAPADVAAVELYAVTSSTPPLLTPGMLPAGLTRLSTTPVRRPLPPKADATAAPPPPRPPGVADQGERLTISEHLTAEARRPDAAGPSESPSVDWPIVAPPVVFEAPGRGIKRHYVAVAVSRGGRRGAWSPVKGVPVAEGPASPREAALTYDATTFTLTWAPSPGVSAAAVASADGPLPSRPLGPPAVATRYNVYAAAAGETPVDAAGGATPLNGEALAAAAWSAPGVVFGQERCFSVRAVEAVDGVDVEGPASAPACVTPRDTFPPAAPTALEAVGGQGVVSLIWDRVDAADLVGYLVFRGPLAGAPDTQLTPEPIVASSFEDRTVVPGLRYGYVVVAVDSATPPNRSAPSNRAEGAARQ